VLSVTAAGDFAVPLVVAAAVAVAVYAAVVVAAVVAVVGVSVLILIVSSNSVAMKHLLKLK
jgi:hypothetical protein